MPWLAVHLPQLSLEAFCAALPDASRAVALVADHRIADADAAAAARGVRAGMRRATALALAPELLLAEADAARDAAARLAVAHAALAFTPMVALHGTATVLLDVGASLRLFGGLAALHRRLVAAVAPLNHRTSVAAAPTPLGAALLAQWPGAGSRSERPASRAASRSERPASRPGFDAVLGDHATQLPALQALLAQAPVWLLGPGREHWEALQGMGLATLADLQSLPRSGLARRFGTALLDDLDRAFGRRADPRDRVELPAAFATRVELGARADTAEQVLHAAAALLARLVAWAGARRVRVAAFTLRMHHEPRRGASVPASTLRIALAEPSLDAAHLHTLLRERLARFDGLAAPTLEIELQCRDTVAAPAPNGELFPTPAAHDAGLGRLLERLRARLGDEQVRRLDAVADHRPERATRTLPAQAEAVVSRAGRAGGAGPAGATTARAATKTGVATTSTAAAMVDTSPKPARTADAAAPTKRTGTAAAAGGASTPASTKEAALASPREAAAASTKEAALASAEEAAPVSTKEAAFASAKGASSAVMAEACASTERASITKAGATVTAAAAHASGKRASTTKAGASAARAGAAASASSAARSAAPSAAAARSAPAAPLHRPVWLLTEPLPLAERDALPLFHGRPLQLVSGPERIESGWWDGAVAARDYFIAEAGDGALVWIWRDRIARADGDGGWFLQGLFA